MQCWRYIIILKQCCWNFVSNNLISIFVIVFRTTALFRQPLLSSVYNIQLLPFAFDVWLVISVMIFVFIVVLFFFTIVNNYLIEKKKITPNIEEIITLVHGALCQQGKSILSSNGMIDKISIRYNYHTSRAGKMQTILYTYIHTVHWNEKLQIFMCQNY